MNRRAAGLVLAALLLALVTLAIILGTRRDEEGVRPADPAEQAVDAGDRDQVTVELYFPGRGGRLYAESRQLPALNEIEERLTQLLEALLAGPESSNLYPALPADITLGWVHVDDQAVAYIDLEIGDDSLLPAWGSRRELLAVYSVVDTTLLNLPEVVAVVLLRNGQQQPTFAGHLDTSRPLLANRDLVASGS